MPFYYVKLFIDYTSIVLIFIYTNYTSIVYSYGRFCRCRVKSSQMSRYQSHGPLDPFLPLNLRQTSGRLPKAPLGLWPATSGFCILSPSGAVLASTASGCAGCYLSIRKPLPKWAFTEALWRPLHHMATQQSSHSTVLRGTGSQRTQQHLYTSVTAWRAFSGSGSARDQLIFWRYCSFKIFWFPQRAAALKSLPSRIKWVESRTNGWSRSLCPWLRPANVRNQGSLPKDHKGPRNIRTNSFTNDWGQ